MDKKKNILVVGTPLLVGAIEHTAAYKETEKLLGHDNKETQQRLQMMKEEELRDYDNLASRKKSGKPPFKKESPDIGRNEPCPCGSGKKYKKCCLQ